MKNRNYVIQDGKDNTTVVAECPHCNEPWTIQNGPIPEHLYEKDETTNHYYCRGANGLSINIICCKVLNCQEKKGHICNLVPSTKDKIYPVNKTWSVIVVEPSKKDS